MPKIFGLLALATVGLAASHAAASARPTLTVTLSAAHRHAHDAKVSKCEKQADAQRLHFSERRTFMKACLAK